MGDIDDFLDFTKKFERKTISSGTVGGRTTSTIALTKPEPKREKFDSTDYADKYMQELKNDLRRVSCIDIS